MYILHIDGRSMNWYKPYRGRFGQYLLKFYTAFILWPRNPPPGIYRTTTFACIRNDTCMRYSLRCHQDLVSSCFSVLPSSVQLPLKTGLPAWAPNGCQPASSLVAKRKIVSSQHPLKWSWDGLRLNRLRSPGPLPSVPINHYGLKDELQWLAQ